MSAEGNPFPIKFCGLQDPFQNSWPVKSEPLHRTYELCGACPFSSWRPENRPMNGTLFPVLQVDLQQSNFLADSQFEHLWATEMESEYP